MFFEHLIEGKITILIVYVDHINLTGKMKWKPENSIKYLLRNLKQRILVLQDIF